MNLPQVILAFSKAEDSEDESYSQRGKKSKASKKKAKASPLITRKTQHVDNTPPTNEASAQEDEDDAGMADEQECDANWDADM